MEVRRQTARALIIAPDNDILLLSVTLPWLIGPTWMLPGGGIEAGETPLQCAYREIFEETGYRHEGDLVEYWHGDIAFEHGDTQYFVQERYFLARANHKFTPSMAEMMDYEKDFTLALKWCSLEDLTIEDVFCSPPQIPAMLESAINGQLPARSEALQNLMPKNFRGAKAPD